MQSNSKTVQEYMASLPEDRRAAIEAVRNIILKNLPKGYEENMRWGMISYEIPLSVESDTYNKQPLSYVGLASQKNYMTCYLMAAYLGSKQERKLRDDYANAGKKLDFGKSCLRFKKLDDVLLGTVGDIVASMSVKEYIEIAKHARTAKS